MKNFQTLDEIELYLKEKVSILLNLEVDKIPSNASLVDELGADSIAIVQLFVYIQEDFGLDMNENLNLGQTITINMIANYIKDNI
ncbi:MAG: phosphopantetheine-binding protein [Ruminococcus sp.]|nr:phosphopantetheine-binding protein [Ruminococcus sp.]